MEIFQRNLRCQFCQQDFERRNILKRHYREKHFCGNVYKCNLCKVSFVRKERLIRHLKSVHFDLKFECEECNMKFVEKYKHNFHLVHCHGYAYCANCKIAYRTLKPLDKSNIKEEDNSYSTNNYNDNEHVCQNFVRFYKCSLGNCKSKKSYNRLNFYIRHLQLEHRLVEFNEIKDNIEQNTYESRKSKRKSRIRAKTLEGHAEDVISEELKELFDYAKLYTAENELNDMGVTPNDILKRLKQQDVSEDGNDAPKRELACEVEGVKREADIRVKEEDRLNYEVNTECKGEPSFKELMQDINIMCMMENNHKKYFNSKSQDEEEILSRNIENDQIRLGKRGRPAKKSNSKQEMLADTVVGSYLNTFEATANTKKIVVKRSDVDIPEKESKETKNKEKKKIKPVYFDDILMETLTITEKVRNKKQIFSVKRADIVIVLNNEPVTRPSSIPFLPVKNIYIELETEQDGLLFDQMKQSRKAHVKSHSNKFVVKREDRPKGFVETFVCDDCEKEFYNVNGYHQHLQSVHNK